MPQIPHSARVSQKRETLSVVDIAAGSATTRSEMNACEINRDGDATRDSPSVEPVVRSRVPCLHLASGVAGVSEIITCKLYE